MNNPYQSQNGAGSQFSRFPFARGNAASQQAPLFHRAMDEFREEDDFEEREREVADHYALQRSRRHFDARKSESEDEDGDGEDEFDEGEPGLALARHVVSRMTTTSDSFPWPAVLVSVRVSRCNPGSGLWQLPPKDVPSHTATSTVGAL